jgi:Carboxypeptidase regulatory-like domain
MKFLYRIGPVLVLVGALGSASVASAQAAAGEVIGEVARCQGTNEIPAPQVQVGIDGGPANLAQTDDNGDFAIALAPGQYTVVASANDGTTASRQYVPVTAGQTLDIGVLDLGAGVAGCGFDSDSSLGIAPLTQPAPADTPAPAPADNSSAA